jgi:hypothetical protein
VVVQPNSRTAAALRAKSGARRHLIDVPLSEFSGFAISDLGRLSAFMKPDSRQVIVPFGDACDALHYRRKEEKN